MRRFGLQDRLFEEAGKEAAAAGLFDPAAFQTALMAEVSKAISAAQAATQKNLLKEMSKFAVKPDPAQAATEAAEAERAAHDAAMAAENRSGEPPKPRDPHVAGLERANKELADRFRALEDKNRQVEEANKQTNLRAEEKERHAAIRASLGDFNFASDDAREDAFRALRDDVKRGEDGELYGGDYVPVKEFIKARMATKTHLLAPKQVDSAGARANAGMIAGRPVQIEEIKTGMKPEAREAAWAAVRATLGVQ